MANPHSFEVDARGRRIRRALNAVGAAVAAYTRFEFDEGAGRPRPGSTRASG